MKKAAALILAMILALSLCSVFAENADEIPGAMDMPFAGLRYVPPESFRDLKGLLVTDGDRELDDGIHYAYWVYLAMTENDYVDFISNPGDSLPGCYLIHVFSLGNGMSFPEFNAMIGSDIPEEAVRQIGQAGDTGFYLYMPEANRKFMDSVSPEFAEEYAALAGAVDDVAAAFTCYEPQQKPDPNAGAVGSKFEFTATDLDGNTVTSADLFAQNEITMINIWATWCSPCVGELPELQQIHTRMQEQNCGVIGMLTDDALDTARQLIADNGVAYPVVKAPAELYSLINLEYIPTSVFVDKDGVILAAPVVGAQVDVYEPTLESLLKK